MEVQPPTCPWASPGNSNLMSRSGDERDGPHCPCGQELEERESKHFLCATHRQQVVSAVKRRFGRHRYGGRYAASVEDFVNDCYEKLLRPGGVASFRAGARPFGGWLHVVVRNFCNNKQDYLLAHPGVAGESLDSALDSAFGVTPDQAFARRYALDLVRDSVAEVEAEWKARGPKASQRFDVFAPFILGEAARYGDAQSALGVTVSNAKKIKSELAEGIRLALRRRVRDTLDIEPGLNHECIERQVDQEIEELLSGAFPKGSELEAMRRKQGDEDEKPELEIEKPESDT